MDISCAHNIDVKKREKIIICSKGAERYEKVGQSRQGLFGSVNTYDNNGHKTSHSDRGLFGGFNHYDKS